MVGGSSGGAAGAFPANGFINSLTTLARTVKTPVGGVAALGVAGCIVTSDFGAATVLFAVDTDDRLDTVVAVGDTAALGFDSKVVVEGGLTTTSLAATVLPGPALSVAVGEEPGEFAGTLADVDGDRSDPDVLCGVTSAPVVLPVVSVGVDAVWALASDDA